MNDPATAGAEGAPAPVDLTGVDPIHWAEARRRVAILREWCATKRHSRAQCVDAAERMGVSVKHFERLVVTWKRFGEARRVSGSGTRRGEARGNRAIPAATRTAIDEAIAALGPDAPFKEVVAEAKRRCAAASTPSASFGMVHYVRMRAPAPTHGEPRTEIRVARVSCLLPMTVGGETAETPELVLAVGIPDGLIVAHRVVAGDDATSAARTVLAEAAALAGDIPIKLAANLADAVPAEFTLPGTPCAPAEMEVANASELRTTFLGSHIDSIPIRHRKGARIRSWPADPLDEADARRAIDEAVAMHNRARAQPRHPTPREIVDRERCEATSRKENAMKSQDMTPVRFSNSDRTPAEGKPLTSIVPLAAASSGEEQQ